MIYLYALCLVVLTVIGVATAIMILAPAYDDHGLLMTLAAFSSMTFCFIMAHICAFEIRKRLK